MRVLLVNPNTTAAVTDTMLAEARRSAAPGTDIVAVSARFGVSYVENRIEAAIASHAVVEALAEHGEDCDGAIVAAFGDPGLWAAKELMRVPVVGISEAAFLTASMLGGRYSIVCLTERLAVWYRECAREHGVDRRLASVRSLDVAPADISTAKEQAREQLLAQCARAVEDDAAEVIVLGGGPIAGLARELRDRLPVPIVDGVSCAVRMVEGLVQLGPRKATRGSFARPSAKPAIGLTEDLLRAITRPG